jgi:hypothetical protein
MKKAEQDQYTIWAITTIVSTKDGFSDSRCVGYCFTAQEAFDLVEGNYADIHECDYNYVIVEELGAGLYPDTYQDYWYEWDIEKEKYVSCEKPEFAEGIVNWGIG